MAGSVKPEQPTRRKPGRPPKPGTKPWLLELAPDVAALVEAHKAAMGVSRTAALEDLVRKGASAEVPLDVKASIDTSRKIEALFKAFVEG